MPKQKIKSTTQNSNSPTIGGHAPEHLRNVFEAFVELTTTDNRALTLDSKIEDDYSGREFTLREIIGLLWNCDDTLPVSIYDDLIDNFFYDDESRPIQTYAAVCRRLKEFL